MGGKSGGGKNSSGGTINLKNSNCNMGFSKITSHYRGGGGGGGEGAGFVTQGEEFMQNMTSHTENINLNRKCFKCLNKLQLVISVYR